MESKKEIYDLIPEQFYPKTLLIKQGDDFAQIKEVCQNKQLAFPMIAKPDIGMRGMAVQKLENDEDLLSYTERVNFDFLVQEYVDLPNEIGVFFVRFPDQEQGLITGIVAKEFLIVTGDGRSSMRNLVESNPRYHMQMDALEKMYGEVLHRVPDKGELVNLVPYGNHARGSRFLNVSNWANEKLTAVLNEVCLQIPHFYYGRLDIKYSELADLEQGRNFSIIELNGAGSEPTHIYDPGQSLLLAWQEIVRHFDMLFQISQINHRKGHRFLSLREGLDMFRQNKLHVQKLEKF